MPRKGGDGKRGGNSGIPFRDGVITPKQFCCGCICFLSSVLIVQVCILASLWRRLSDVHHSVEPLSRLPQVQTIAAAPRPIVPSAASAANAAAAPSPQSALQLPIKPSVGGTPDASKPVLAMGASFGLGADAVLIFLASLQKVSPGCFVVLFTDKALSSSDMKAVGVDERQVNFQIVQQAGLPAPWNNLHMSSTRWWLYQNYLLRTRVETVYGFVQLSDISDVAFQGDPFAWAKSQASGLHVFLEEPGRSVSAEKNLLTPLHACYGDQSPVTMNVQQQLITSHGYMIGAARDVAQYVDKMVSELNGHPSCHQGQKLFVDGAIHNVLVRNSGVTSNMHENHKGPVWNGKHVLKEAVKMDGQYVTTEDGLRYLVLHEYDTHEDLWRSITDRYLGARKKQLASLDCSQFDVAAGDIKGSDLSHMPADSQKDCCVACLGDAGCGAFIFKPSAKHCWLKRPGNTVRAPAKDTFAGILRMKRS